MLWGRCIFWIFYIWIFQNTCIFVLKMCFLQVSSCLSAVVRLTVSTHIRTHIPSLPDKYRPVMAFFSGRSVHSMLPHITTTPHGPLLLSKRASLLQAGIRRNKPCPPHLFFYSTGSSTSHHMQSPSLSALLLSESSDPALNITPTISAILLMPATSALLRSRRGKHCNWFF